MKDNYRNDMNKKNSVGSNNYATKLKFTDDEEDSVLVFEHDASSKPKKDKVKPNNSPDSVAKPKEFELPEKYTVNKKYNSSRMIIDEAPAVKHVYMPKFTEVSQNYRVAESPKVRKKFTLKKVDAVSVNDEAVKANGDASDPTDESVEQGNISDAKVVTMGVPAPEKQELKSTIFKFETKDEEKMK